MKKIYTVTTICLFALILALPWIFDIFKVDLKIDVIDEKRELAAYPKKYSDDYFDEINNYVNDNVPYREEIITILKEKQQEMEVGYRNNILPIISNAFKPEWFDEEQQKLNNNPNFLDPVYESKIIYGRNNWLFYNSENNIDYYVGGNSYKEGQLDDIYLKAYRLYARARDLGIHVSIIMAPNKEVVYSEEMPSLLMNENRRTDELVEHFNYYGSAMFEYILDPLLEYKDKYEVYYRQDTHWNSVGAYIGLMEAYKLMGKEYIPLEELKITPTTKIGGDLSNFCGYSSEYVDYIVPYHDDIKEISREEYVDGSVEIITSSNDNNKKCVLIGDSFRSALIPYLEKDYQQLTVSHRDSIWENEIYKAIRQLNSGDDIIIVCSERFDYILPDTLKIITEYLYAIGR